MASKEQTKKKILLIDDEKEALSNIKNLLAKSDFTIIINNDLSAVIDLMNNDDIDAVIAEFNSKNPEVEKCVKEIKRIKGDTIPIVLLTNKKTKQKKQDELIKVAEYTGMAHTSSYDLKGLVKSLTKELSDFKLIDPDDFTSIEIEGQIISMEDGTFITDFQLIEYTDKEFWIEISENVVQTLMSCRFQIRLMEKDFAIDLDFEGKIVEMFNSEEDCKITLKVEPSKPEQLKELENIKEKLDERQSSIVSFLNKTKGLE